ncbi:nucleobase:cation symporter-2, NCS2 family [Syntrophus gentianae]|uniref:Nucleobase:cation symporter-2, NCS2 family n=1 Tax=Syntrophus gentianae TaxID=43775 RepID=A0A1H7VL81_9BACT|nr:solute carrier family 23 protein [Syntrophus gentianae]SEM09659.1 nucleobase:cation symporter-2, NCS2 family [Syntrophus gentianae]
MPRKPSNLVYGVDDIPPLRILLVLAIQHIFFLTAGLITAALIAREIGGTPELVQSIVCMSMIAGGIATILQALNKGPVGSGYLCTEGIDPTFVSCSILAGLTGGISMILGMTVFSGLLECLISRGINRMRILFPPEVTGVVLTMVGLNIVPVMISNFFGISGKEDAVQPANLFVAAATLAGMVGTNVWSKGKLRFYSVIIGMAVGYLAAYLLGVLKASDLERISQSPLLSFPDLSHIGWSFSPLLLVPFISATIASSLKAVATFTMCQKINDSEWKRPDLNNIQRGMLADGLASVFGGLLGGMGQSLYAGSVGLSAATGTTSRIVAFVTGGMFITLAFLPKMAAVFSIMPKPVMGGALVFMVSFMVISGIQIMTSRMMDVRKTFVVGISLMFGISADIFPGLYRNFHPLLEPFFSSSLAVTTLLAISLNLLFRIGIARREVLELEPGVDSSQTIFAFMENQGAAWGARGEVIQKAKMALNEFFESASHLGIAEGKIVAEVFFDEFNLNITIRYQGTPVEFSDVLLEGEALLDDENAFINLSFRIIQQYADRVESEEKDGQCRVLLHFDH